MLAYRMVSPNEKARAVQKRYLRQTEKANELGYEIKSPKHLEQLKKDWNLFEAGELLF